MEEAPESHPWGTVKVAKTALRRKMQILFCVGSPDNSLVRVAAGHKKLSVSFYSQVSLRTKRKIAGIHCLPLMSH
jgi:hypothetical protein